MREVVEWQYLVPQLGKHKYNSWACTSFPETLVKKHRDIHLYESTFSIILVPQFTNFILNRISLYQKHINYCMNLMQEPLMQSPVAYQKSIHGKRLQVQLPFWSNSDLFLGVLGQNKVKITLWVTLVIYLSNFVFLFLVFSSLLILSWLLHLLWLGLSVKILLSLLNRGYTCVSTWEPFMKL